MPTRDDEAADAALARIEVAKARARKFPRSLKQAVRAFCLECFAGDWKDVYACPSEGCALHHVRPRPKEGQ